VTDFRVGVLGLGGIGSAAAYWASRRLGPDVLGVEQFQLGHVRGGSEDHSRIIRLSYHTPGYVELAKAAYVAWEQVEVDSGESLVLRTGGLDLAPVGATIGLDDYRASMKAAGVGFEELDAGEVMRRWPQWQLSDDVTALFQEQSGIAMASRANSAHRRLAVENGATLVEGSEVEASARSMAKSSWSSVGNRSGWARSSSPPGPGPPLCSPVWVFGSPWK
jgi:sarcosine oxidase